MSDGEVTRTGNPIRAVELARFFSVPDLYVSDIRWQSGIAVVRRMSRAAYTDSVFLDERTRAVDGATVELPVRTLMEAYRSADPPRRPLAFVQHSALCGSTLLCRCLDIPGRCLPYKEPYLLHNLSGIWRLGAQDRLQAGLPSPDTPILDVVLAMLARTYRAGERSLVKLTDSCVSLCGALIDHHPGSRLLLMYQPLRRFLLAMLRDPQRRAYVRNMQVRAHVDLTASGKQHLVCHDIDRDGRAAAYLWIALMYPYLRLLAVAPLQVRSLNAVDFFDQPVAIVRSVNRFLNLGLDDDVLATRLADGVLDRHSKDTERPFESNEVREASDQSTCGLSAEVDDAIDWAGRLTRNDPIPQTLPGPV